MADAIVTRRSPRFKDLSGQTFGLLTALHEGPLTSDGRATWVCRCKCGDTKLVTGKHLRRGIVKSCGCSTTALKIKARTKHGATKGGVATPEYYTWAAIKQRCTYANGSAWENYGGRGITFADEFKNNFQAFYAYVGPRPSPQHSIERIDNEKGYERGNLKWATRREQQRNQRRNRYLEARGKRQIIADWAAETGLSAGTIWDRLARGWEVERALFTPPMK